MPPNPPKRHPSSTTLPAVEEVAPGAIHDFRAPQSTDTISTVPPPAPDHRAPPKEYAGPRTMVRAPGPKPPPLPFAGSEEHTLAGPSPVLAAPAHQEPQDGDGDRKSVHEAIQSADTLTGLVAAKNAELAESRAELAAKIQEARAAEARTEQLRVELEAGKRVPVVEPVAPPEAPTRVQWHALLYKLGGAMVAVLVPCGAYLAYRVETLAPRVTTTQQNVSVVEAKAVKGRDLQRETLEFLAAWQVYQECLAGQFGSAIVRGTGHLVTSAPEVDASELWAEQNAPPTRPGPLWPRWTWHTIKTCGPEPHVPTLPP